MMTNFFSMLQQPHKTLKTLEKINKEYQKLILLYISIMENK